jgi:hypothetical protein
MLRHHQMNHPDWMLDDFDWNEREARCVLGTYAAFMGSLLFYAFW